MQFSFTLLIPLQSYINGSQQQIMAASKAVNVRCSIGKVSSSPARMTVTAAVSPSNNVTAVCQLQRYMNGSWTNELWKVGEQQRNKMKKGRCAV